MSCLLLSVACHLTDSQNSAVQSARLARDLTYFLRDPLASAISCRHSVGGVLRDFFFGALGPFSLSGTD